MSLTTCQAGSSQKASERGREGERWPPWQEEPGGGAGEVGGGMNQRCEASGPWKPYFSPI